MSISILQICFLETWHRSKKSGWESGELDTTSQDGLWRPECKYRTFGWRPESANAIFSISDIRSTAWKRPTRKRRGPRAGSAACCKARIGTQPSLRAESLAVRKTATSFSPTFRADLSIVTFTIHHQNPSRLV